MNVGDWLQYSILGYSMLIGLCMVLFGYAKVEDVPAGLHIVTFLLGAPASFLFAFTVVWLRCWLTTGTGLALLLFLSLNGLHAWTIATGLGFLFIGVICAEMLRRNRGAEWVANSVGGYALGLVMIVMGTGLLLVNRSA